MPSVSGVRWPTACPLNTSGATLASPWTFPVFVAWSMLSSSCSGLHRFDDFYVAGATAKVSRQRFANLRLARLRVAAQQRFGRHDHSCLLYTSDAADE